MKYTCHCHCLADCASGEWGPAKATRLFGLVPMSHQDALIFAGQQLDINFKMTRYYFR